MRLKMSENSLFAILLRSSWWISLLVALFVATLSRAVLPDAAQTELLGLNAPEPLLSVERVAYTYNDAPMEVRRGLYRTDRHHYFNTLN